MTSPTQEVRFGPYRLDLAHPCLWKTTDPVALQPKPLAVLGYLAARPGVVVGRDELIRTLWAGTFVTKAVLKVAVRAIREALGDDAGAPRRRPPPRRWWDASASWRCSAHSSGGRWPSGARPSS